MEQLYWKMDLDATCPYCGKEGPHTFYLNCEDLPCPYCGNIFEIELFVKSIEVRSRKR